MFLTWVASLFDKPSLSEEIIMYNLRMQYNYYTVPEGFDEGEPYWQVMYSED